MTNPSREQRIKRILEDIDTALPADDPEALRAVQAVRASTPKNVITLLEEKGLLDEMLTGMQRRFKGRPLESIPSTELIQIARDSVDETMGIEPLQRDTGFPEPRVSNTSIDHQAEQTMQDLAEVVERWQHHEVTSLEAAEQAERILHGKRQSRH